MARSIEHTDGRFCQQQPDGTWVTTEGVVCGRVHLVAGIDRGEFGMPTIGGGIASMPDDVPPWTVGSPDRVVLIDNHDCVRLTVKPTTKEATRIVGQWLPEMMERFLRNNTKYARAQSTDLGAKGIMPDINRKTAVLLDRLWFGAEVVGEPTVEVIDDLIGHLFLLKDKVVQETGEDNGSR